jgi:4-hydroxy-tetrahydrodipicolinate synthase
VAIEGTPLPVLLYNAPQYTRTAIAPQTVKALAGHESVLGIKDSSGDLSYLSNLTGIIPARGFSVLVGSEVLLWESHQMGCQGGVCGGANLFPKLYSRFFQSFAEGEPDQTIQIQSLIKRIQEEVYHNFNTPLSHIIGLKYLMEVRGLCRSQMAMPVYRQLYPAQKKSMAALMEEFIALGY